MARTGVYVAFHGGGTTDPTAPHSDIKHYNMMKAWHDNKKIDFSFSNSHDRTGSVRDSSLKATLERALKTRLLESKSLVLITSPNTRRDTDWVEFEIKYAADDCQIPIICAYPNQRVLTSTAGVRHLWPDSLARRIDADKVKTLHVPFLLEPLKAAINTFSVHNPPNYAQTCYTEEAYRGWGISENYQRI